MTFVGSATLAMMHAIASDTYDRVFEWFKEHPEAQFAYWAKNEFLSDKATEDEKKDFVVRHPEIDDLNDHTTVMILNDSIILQTFCPRLKAGIKEIYDDGIHSEDLADVYYTIEPDADNYRIVLSHK